MADVRQITLLSATLIPVGLSQVVRVMPGQFQYAETIKILAAGGTLELVPAQLSGSSTAAGNAWGKGYPIGSSEVLSIGGPATFYLAATGATMIAAVVLGYTPGASLL